MLDELRDYPRNFLDIYFQEYSDGIISGGEIEIEDNLICINPGIIKFNNLIYVLNQVEKIEYTSTDEQVVFLKIRFLESEDTGDSKLYNSEIFIDEDGEFGTNELELARFKLRKGARLRTAYNAFSDFATEYNTVNIINVKYSGLKEHTINPMIIDEFTKVIMAKSEETLDINFAMTALNAGIVNRRLIKYYLNNRLRLDKEEYSNIEIYNHLKRIIKRLEGGELNKRRRRSRKMIVD